MARSKFRDSAAVVLIRGHGDALECFWVLRSDAVPFMPGFHAFPGGSVDEADASLALPPTGDEIPPALRACVIREALEETGVLVGLDGPPPPEAVRTAARQALLAGETTLPALAQTHGWRFRPADLAFAGRWQTPPFAAMRFDTLFFLARVGEGQTPVVEPGELASGEWITPATALERWREGEATFAAPILHTLREIAAGEDGLAARLASAPARAGQPPRRIELKWGVVLQPMKTRPLPPSTHTNAYVVGEGEVALIDPGSDDPGELELLFTLLDGLAAEGRTLKMVLVSHHHPDHVGGLAAVRERYRVPVAAHPGTAQRIGADVAIEDGARISLAHPGRSWDLEAIHTPGHARGHLCFFEPRTRSLFTGDHVIGGRGTVIVDPPEGDMGDYVASLERLARLDAGTIFPGHGSPQGGVRRRIEGLVAHRRRRETAVRAALGAEPRTLATLVEGAYADTPRDLWSYAERSLLAHLIDLERRGLAAREGERWRSAGAAASGGGPAA